MTQHTKLTFLVASIVLSCAVVSLGLETLARNHLGWMLVVIGIAYCMGGSVYLAAAQVRGSLPVATSDRSLWLIVPGLAAAFAAPPLEYLYLPSGLPRTDPLQLAGLLVLGAGLGLRFWARWALDRVDGSHLPPHRLVRAGPYRLMRHPDYAGLGLVALGVCMGYSSLIGLAALAMLWLPGIAYRISLDERQLIGQWGEAYRAYQRQAKRLVPGIW